MRNAESLSVNVRKLILASNLKSIINHFLTLWSNFYFLWISDFVVRILSRHADLLLTLLWVLIYLAFLWHSFILSGMPNTGVKALHNMWTLECALVLQVVFNPLKSQRQILMDSEFISLYFSILFCNMYNSIKVSIVSRMRYFELKITRFPIYLTVVMAPDWQRQTKYGTFVVILHSSILHGC